MSYGLIYRGEFSNTLDNYPSGYMPVDQVVRIDISDTTTGAIGGSIIGNVIVLSSTSLSIGVPVIIPTVSLAERTAFWQTYDNFFNVGMLLRVTGTPAGDGDYTIIGKTPHPPTNAVSNDPGSFQLVLNMSAGSGSVGIEGVLFENITIPTIIELSLDGDPLHISVIDNNEDKFTPVRSKQAEIKIKTGNSIDLNTFCEGEDQRYYVEIFVDDLIIFRGFLMIPDMQQEFMPDPNILILTATDNLPLLRDIALVDTANTTPRLDWRLIDYIRWSLRLTGIEQNINIINSVKHGTTDFISIATFSASGQSFATNQSFNGKFYPGQPLTISGTASNDGNYIVLASAVFVGVLITVVDQAVIDEANVSTTFTDTTNALPFYQAIYLDAKTFEASINVCINCYDVLLRILGEDCVLFQYQGEWWIVRIDEVEEIAGVFQYSVDHYDSTGTFLSNEIINKSKNIGDPDTMHFMNDDAIVIPDRAYNHVRETYKYEYPAEIICNIDFSRGDYVEDLTPTTEELNDGVKIAKKFEIDDWALMRGNPEAAGSPIANDSEAYIKRLYNVVDYETNRYVVITSPSAFNIATPYIMSCPYLKVRKYDRFEASATYRFSANPGSGGGGTPFFRFALKGSNGHWYLLTIKDTDNGFDTIGPRWVDTAGWTVNTSLADYGFNFSDGTDYATQQTFSYDFDKVPPIPIDGVLYVMLHGLNFQSASSDNVDVYWSSLNFTYWPLINGSYRKYTGQDHQVSQLGNNKAVREKQVYMSDSPSLMLKGAMKFFNGTDYVLTFGFIDNHNTTPVPFGQIQAFAVWNQYRVSARNFDGDVKRLESETIDDDGQYDGVDLIDKIELTDTDASTNNRYFLILHYDIDYYLLEMKCYIASLYRTDLGKVYTDDHIFIYTTE